MPRPLVLDDDWVVACKHMDGVDEIIRVDQLVDHHPSHVTDFNSTKRYMIISNEWSKHKSKYQFFEVFIGRIAENTEALKESINRSRPLWPTASDAFSSESETEQVKKVQPKTSNLGISNMKKRANTSTIDEFVTAVSSDKSTKVLKKNKLSKYVSLDKKLPMQSSNPSKSLDCATEVDSYLSEDLCIGPIDESLNAFDRSQEGTIKIIAKGPQGLVKIEYEDQESNFRKKALEEINYWKLKALEAERQVQSKSDPVIISRLDALASEVSKLQSQVQTALDSKCKSEPAEVAD